MKLEVGMAFLNQHCDLWCIIDKIEDGRVYYSWTPISGKKIGRVMNPCIVPIDEVLVYVEKYWIPLTPLMKELL